MTTSLQSILRILRSRLKSMCRHLIVRAHLHLRLPRRQLGALISNPVLTAIQTQMWTHCNKVCFWGDSNRMRWLHQLITLIVWMVRIGESLRAVVTLTDFQSQKLREDTSLVTLWCSLNTCNISNNQIILVEAPSQACKTFNSEIVHVSRALLRVCPSSLADPILWWFIINTVIREYKAPLQLRDLHSTATRSASMLRITNRLHLITIWHRIINLSKWYNLRHLQCLTRIVSSNLCQITSVPLAYVKNPSQSFDRIL